MKKKQKNIFINYQNKRIYCVRNDEKSLWNAINRKDCKNSFVTIKASSFESNFKFRSALKLILIEFKIPSTKPTQGEAVCFKDSKMYCMKSQQIGQGRAMLASTANSALFWQIGRNTVS